MKKEVPFCYIAGKEPVPETPVLPTTPTE